MNVFVVPSWYPSASNPLNGIFIKEQVLAMAGTYKDINFGISTWGQNNEDFLLYAGKPFSTIGKFLTKHESRTHSLTDNAEEYFTPAFSFTNKLFKGNINKIIKANYDNYHRFEERFGKIDLIHAHVCYKAGYIAYQMSGKLNIPYIITEHIGPFPQKYHVNTNGELMTPIKNALDNADLVTAVSEDLSNVIKRYTVNREIKVIPNFIDAASHTVIMDDKKDVFSFVTLSGMSMSKGLGELLEGIKIALQTSSKMHFTMVGGGPDLVQLKSYAENLGIGQHITWTGMVPKEETGYYLQQSDVHILTSHYESFGVAYIEAMAHGIPNIAAALGGPKDIIDHETGILMNEVDPNVIAEKILWITENYNEFDREKISASFKRRFSKQAVAPQIKKMYEDIVRK